MTLIVTVIPTLLCHSDESQNRRFLTITQIPDQVRNDGTAVVILMLPPLTVILTKVRIYLILN